MTCMAQQVAGSPVLRQAGFSCVAKQVSTVLPSRSLLCCQAGLYRVAKHVPCIFLQSSRGIWGAEPPRFSGGVVGGEAPPHCAPWTPWALLGGGQVG